MLAELFEHVEAVLGELWAGLDLTRSKDRT